LSDAYDEAAATFAEALAIFRGFDGITGAAAAMGRLANVARARGDRESATRLHRDALGVEHDAGFTFGLFGQLLNLAEIAVDAGMWESAALLLGGESISRTQIGYEGFWDTPAIRERLQTAISAQLGAERFQQAWERGRALTRDALVAEALAIAKALEAQ
jgi:hypothetical protein